MPSGRIGGLASHIPDVDVFQLHREPKGWQWLGDNNAPEFQIQEPDIKTGQPALVLALSATVTDDRIHAVLGEDVAIWRVMVDDSVRRLRRGLPLW